MSRSDYVTSFALDTYAKMLGINPISFSGCVLTGISTPLTPPSDTCSDIWFQYAWQHRDQVSRDDLGREIQNAEKSLRDYLGYYYTPRWVVEELHTFDPHHLEYWFGVTGYNVEGNIQKIRLENAYVTEVGQRKVTKLATPTVAGGTMVFSDPDGDTFKELCTITVNIGTAVIDKKTVKLFTAGMNGDEIWEIKYPKTIVIAGAVMTITLDSWLLIDHTLWDDYPLTSGEKAIDITTNNRFEATVDVYIETVDRTLPAVTFYWEGYGNVYSQDGWISISGTKKEFAQPYPAEYDDVTDSWIPICFTYNVPPSYMKLYYRAGLTSRLYFGNKVFDPLDTSYAQVIAWLATPRLERTFCNCGNLTSLVEEWRTDLSIAGAGNPSHYMPFGLYANPFGTRKSEMWAWQRVSKYGLRARSTGGVTI